MKQWPTRLRTHRKNKLQRLQRHARRRRQPHTLKFEALETRALLATFAVTNTSDSGAGSLRWAIEQANANTGGDQIAFEISAGDPGFVDADSQLAGGDALPDVFVIAPLSPLPAISDPTGGTVIDGHSQRAFGGDTNPFGPEVVIDGTALTGSAQGLQITSDGNAVHGVNIRGFSIGQQNGRGIRVSGGNDNWISGNYLGVDATGSTAVSNAGGIDVRFGGTGNVIGTNGDGVQDEEEGNLISGNWFIGVHIRDSGSDGNVIAGNRIGTDRTGTMAIGNAANGPGAVTIEGGSTGNRVGVNADGIADSAERNLISGNEASGVRIDATDTIVAGNYIGVNVTGNVALPNDGYGILLAGGATGTIVGVNGDGDGAFDETERNIVSGNASAGISVGGTQNVVAGNFIGTDVSGRNAVGNLRGVVVTGLENTIGVDGNGIADAAERNVVSGNTGDGIRIVFGHENVIAGNFVGVDETGAAPLGNSQWGVVIQGGQSNLVGTNADGISDDLERNVISANRIGVRVRRADSTGNVIAGNLIGTDAVGTAALGNADHGIFLDNGGGNRIGTDGNGIHDQAETNVISGNGNGIRFDGSDDNSIAGNLIGTDITGANPLGNAATGVLLRISSLDNTIGGSGSSMNIIAFNGGAGVSVQRDSAGTEIRGNSIHSNSGLGIDLGPFGADGVTPNDLDDVDGGSNHLQNFPILSSVQASNQSQISGSLQSTSNAIFMLDFYANSVPDPSGHGEGQRWLGTILVTTDASGSASFQATLNAAILPEEYVSATATDSAGNTSEFSLAVEAVISNSPPELDPQNFRVDENKTAIAMVAAIDSDLPNETLTFSITGNGPDDAKSVITAEGELSFIAAPDFENPTDIGGAPGDNTYVVEVQVEDSYHKADTALMSVTVDPVNDNAPLFTSGTIEIAVENTTAVQVVSATDDDQPDQAVTFSITGNGADDALFRITGDNQLEFVAAPDFETPLDADGGNVYEVEILADDGAGLTTTQTVSVSLMNQASISGAVFVDVNENGLYDGNEPGIDGVLIELLDELVAPVLDDFGEPIIATTSDGGFYLFDDLDPGNYQVFENHPTGISDGPELLGSLGGTVVADDSMALMLNRIDASDYMFAEMGQEVTSGDTAAIGFWQNKHGQDLIAQGGAALADWLSQNFSNVFGDDLVGADGADVASFFKNQLFKQKGKKPAGPAKVDAQFMAVALATYFTSSNLAGSVATDYGFHVTQTGIGTKLVNVGSAGAAFDVADGADRTILQLLSATNALTDAPDAMSGFAHTYDSNGGSVIDSVEAALRSMANEIYSGINEDGGI